MVHRKKLLRVSNQRSDFFDGLPDDIVLSILCKLASSSNCPSDFINVLQTCKRLNKLGNNPLVLSRTGSKVFGIRAQNWCENAERFLRLCIKARNVEAYYTLGMIRFYCLQNRGSGASLMAKAAVMSHAPALYSLAVIQFNGSGASKNDKDLRAGVALCARAAYLGHIDALRELGHCFQDGYGVSRNVAEGRRLLIQANALELQAVLRAAFNSPPFLQPPSSENIRNGLVTDPGSGPCYSMLSDFGCSVPARETHPVHRFMREWFESTDEYGPGRDLRMCSHGGCGRPETRRNEFRRCSVCGTVNYCSRGCQALDWKARHKAKCAPVDHWIEMDGGDDVADRMGEMEEVDGGAL